MRIMLLTIGTNFVHKNQPEPIRNEQAAVKLALEKIYPKNTPNLREVHIVRTITTGTGWQEKLHKIL
jgi:hypothetical protein